MSHACGMTARVVRGVFEVPRQCLWVARDLDRGVAAGRGARMGPVRWHSARDYRQLMDPGKDAVVQ